MSKLDFSIKTVVPPDRVMKYFLDFDYYKNYFPKQLRNVTVITRTDDEIHTAEEITFATLIKNVITQKSIHKKISDRKIITEIVEGPAKGTIITISANNMELGSEINCDIELKLSLKAKFLEPLIKKWYKRYLASLIYKFQTRDHVEGKASNE